MDNQISRMHILNTVQVFILCFSLRLYYMYMSVYLQIYIYRENLAIYAVDTDHSMHTSCEFCCRFINSTSCRRINAHLMPHKKH